MFLKTFWPFFSPASVCLGTPFCPPVPSPYPGAYGDEPWGLSSCTGFAYFLDAFPMTFKVHSRNSLNTLHAVFKNRVQNALATVWRIKPPKCRCFILSADVLFRRSLCRAWAVFRFTFVLNCDKNRLQFLERRGIWVQTTNTQLNNINYTPLGRH